MTSGLNLLVEAESQLRCISATSISTAAQQARSLLDIVVVFQVAVALIPADLNESSTDSILTAKNTSASDLEAALKACSVVAHRGINLVNSTLQLIKSLDSLHQTTVSVVTNACLIYNQTEDIKRNIKLIERCNEQLVDIVAVAKHGLDSRRIENALDATSIITNPTIRNFWTKRIGKTVDRVDVALFVKLFQDHIKETIKESRNIRAMNVEKINEDGDVSEILFSRMLTTLLTSKGTNQQISVYDVVDRLSGFSEESLDFAKSTANHAIATELALLRKVEFLPVQAVQDATEARANYQVLQKGETGLYHGDKIIKTTPLQRVPILCNLPKFDATRFPRDGITLVRYNGINNVHELAENTSFSMTEVETTRAYLSSSSNALYVDGVDSSNWNTLPSLGSEEFVTISPGKQITKQFATIPLASKTEGDNNAVVRLKQVGVQEGVELLYTPTVQEPGIYSVRNFLEDANDATPNNENNGTRYLYNNLSTTALEQFESRDFFFQPITIKGVGVRNMYQYVEVVISLLCMDLHRAVEHGDLPAYNATNRLVTQFINNVTRFVHTYRNDATSIKEIGILPVVKISWNPPAELSDKISQHDVKLFGSLNNWSTSNRLDMHRIANEDSYSYVVRLFPGRYLFKFEVDGKEVITDDYPSLDFHGMKVNYLDVSLGQTIGRLTRNSLAAKPEEPIVEVDFRWEEGGDDVQLVGSFTDWMVPIRMVKSTTSGEFSVKVLLCEGHHQYRFLVDGRIRVATHQANVHDALGNINNVVYVSKHEDENPIHCHFISLDAGNKTAEVFFESSLLGCEDDMCDDASDTLSNGLLAVTGSFVRWEKNLKMSKNASKGLFETKKPQSLPIGRHDYVFCVDGQWKYDPLLPFRQDERGNTINFLVVRYQPSIESSKSSHLQTPATPASCGNVRDASGKRKMLFLWGPIESNVNKRVSVLVRGESLHERYGMTYSPVDKVFSCIQDLPLGQYDYKYIVDGEYRLAFDHVIKVNKDTKYGDIELVNTLTITESDVDFPETALLPSHFDDVHPTTPLTTSAITPQSVRSIDRHSHRSPLAHGMSLSPSVTGFSAPAKTHAYSPVPSPALSQRVMVEFDVTTTIPQTKEVLLVGTLSSQADTVGAEMDRAVDSDNKYHKCMSVALGEQFVYHYEIDGQRTYSPDQVLTIDPYTKQVKNFMVCGESIMNGHKRRIGDVWHIAHEFHFNIADTERVPDSVFLTGNFIGWEKDHILMARHGRTFKTTLMLPPGKYEYNFYVDCAWRSSNDDEFTIAREKSRFVNVRDDDEVVNNTFKFNVLFLSDGDMLDEITGLQALDSVAMAAIQIRALKQFQAFMSVSSHTTTTELLTRCADVVDRLTALARQMTSDPIDRAKSQYLLDKFPATLLKKENFLVLEQMLAVSGSDQSLMAIKKDAVLLVLKIYRFFDLVELLDGVHRFSKKILKGCVDHLPFLVGIVADELECSRDEYRVLLDLFLVWGSSINVDMLNINAVEREELMLNDCVGADELNNLAKNCLIGTPDVPKESALLADFYFVKMLILDVASREAYDARTIDALRQLSNQTVKLQEMFLHERTETGSNDCCNIHDWLKAIFFIPSGPSSEETTAAKFKKLADAMRRDFVTERNSQFGKDVSRADTLEILSKFRSKLQQYSILLENPVTQREVPVVLPRSLAVLADVKIIMKVVDAWMKVLQKRGVQLPAKLSCDIDAICDPDLLGHADFDKYVLAVLGLLKGHKWHGGNISSEVRNFIDKVKVVINAKREERLAKQRQIVEDTKGFCHSPEIDEWEPHRELSITLRDLLSNSVLLFTGKDNLPWRSSSLFTYKPHASITDIFHNAHIDETLISNLRSEFAELLDIVQKSLSSHKPDFDSFLTHLVGTSPNDVLDQVRFLHGQVLARLEHYRQLHSVLFEVRAKVSVEELDKFRNQEQKILTYLQETLHMLHSFFYLVDILQILLRLRKDVDRSLDVWRQGCSPLPSATSKHLDIAEKKLFQMQILASEFRRGVTGVANRASEMVLILQTDFESWMWEGHQHQHRHDVAIASMVKDARFHQLPADVKSLLNRMIAAHIRVGLLDIVESSKCGDYSRVHDAVIRLTSMTTDLLDSFLNKTCFLCPCVNSSRAELLFQFGSFLCNTLAATPSVHGAIHTSLPASVATSTLNIWGDLEVEMTKTQRSRDLVRDIKNFSQVLMATYRRHHVVKELVELRAEIEKFIRETLSSSLKSSVTEKSQELNAFVLDLLRRIALDLTEMIHRALLESPSFGLKHLLDEDHEAKTLLPHGLLIQVADVHSLAWGQTSSPQTGKSAAVIHGGDTNISPLNWKPLVSMEFPFQIVTKLSIAHTLSPQQVQNARVGICHYVSCNLPMPTTLVAYTDDRDEIIVLDLDLRSGVTEVPLSDLHHLLSKAKNHRVFISFGIGRKPIRESPVLELEMTVVSLEKDDSIESLVA